MDPSEDYRLIVRSNGSELLVTVEGDLHTAARQVREVAVAAAKLGIAVRVDGRREAGPAHVTGASHPSG